jgi:hypothetical protein
MPDRVEASDKPIDANKFEGDVISAVVKYWTGRNPEPDACRGSKQQSAASAGQNVSMQSTCAMRRRTC